MTRNLIRTVFTLTLGMLLIVSPLASVVVVADSGGTADDSLVVTSAGDGASYALPTDVDGVSSFFLKASASRHETAPTQNNTTRENQTAPVQNVSDSLGGKAPVDLRNWDARLPTRLPNAHTAPDRIVVVLELTPSGNVTQSVTALRDMGATIQQRHANRVQAEINLSDVATYKNRSFVTSLRKPVTGVPTGTVSEGVQVIEASQPHSAGITGKNVKIGVLSVGGFNTSNSEISGNLAATQSFTTDGIENNGKYKHGTGVSEIAVDVAPNASLYLANYDTGIQYANAVDWMRQKEVDVIVMSVSFFLGPHDGTGFISTQATQAVNDGIVWANSAGNSALSHWNGSYRSCDGDRIMDFSSNDCPNSPDEINLLQDGQKLQRGDVVRPLLKWNDWPDTSQDYDLYLLRWNSTQSEWKTVSKSTKTQDGNDAPYEFIATRVPKDGVYSVAIKNAGADGTQELELFFLATDTPPEHNVRDSSVTAPAVARGVLSVGAFYWETGEMEAFSSQGPTNDGRLGVDVVAPDGVSTASYSGPFFGTSASAPHVAGAVALLKAKAPNASPSRIEQVLESTATDIGPAGSDSETGYGKINVSAAAAEFNTSSSSSPSPVVAVTNATIQAGQTARVNVTVDSLPNGLQTYNMTVQIANGSVADIGEVVGNRISGSNFRVVGRTHHSITFEATDLGFQVQPGATNVSLATLSLNNTVAGTTVLNITVVSMTNDNGTLINSTTEAGHLTVTEAEPNSRPMAVFSSGPPIATVGELIQFNATNSSDPDGSIVTYAWDFNNDGHVDATGPTPTYRFNTSGTKTVQLTVTDDDGLTANQTQSRLVPKATNTTVAVTLTNASEGLRKYSLTLNTTNGLVRHVTPVLIQEPSFQMLSSRAEPTLRVRAADLAGTVQNFSGNKTLFTATFAGELTAANLSLTVHTLVDDQGEPLPERKLTVTVGDGALFDAPLPGVGGQAPPTDPDADGKYEDVNGDGVATFNDAVGLSFTDTTTLTPKQIQALDFDGDGDVDFADAVELSFQL